MPGDINMVHQENGRQISNLFRKSDYALGSRMCWEILVDRIRMKGTGVAQVCYKTLEPQISG